MAFIKKYFILAVAIALFTAAGMLVTPLHKQQIRYDLTSEPVKGLGPDIVLLTTALGAFRGIIINVIWIRKESLKQDGKFFEIAQLADLACRLAPRFPKVWDFNAWNMAYNISVQIPNHRERWPWVRRGIELLRDQGIPNNPEEPELYFSLAWIYMHKVGDELDDAHFWYKQRLGLKMHEVLGGRGAREFLQTMSEMPGHKDTLLQDDEVGELYEMLVAAGFDPLRVGEEGGLRYFDYLRNPGAIPERARDLMQAERYSEPMKEIDLFARAHRLRVQMKLLPEVMLGLMDEYGPLDWRNAYSHAIYWATLGRRVALAFRTRALWQRMRAGDMTMEEIIQAGMSMEDDDVLEWSYPYRYQDIDYDRIIYGSLQKFVTNGRLLFDSQGRLMPLMGPDYRFTDAMIDQFELMLTKYGETGRHITGISSGYEHFLRRAVIEFFFMGSTSTSQRYHEKLKERFPKTSYQVPFEQFINDELLDYIQMASASEMRRIVMGFLYQSYFHLGAGAEDRADALYARARHMAQIWNEEQMRDDDTSMRQAVDFAAIRESVLIDIFAGVAAFPDEFVNVLREILPQELVSRIEEAAKQAEEEMRLTPTDIEERMQELMRQRQ